MMVTNITKHDKLVKFVTGLSHMSLLHDHMTQKRIYKILEQIRLYNMFIIC